tara:strand:+ start:4397 stop:5062 length:666 start_codon:yes stop_codon:yes gene_type:complete
LEKFSNYLISPNLKKFNKFDPKLKIAVLASGEGTNFQILIDLFKTKKLDIDIKLLITNNENAGCIKRAIKSRIPFFKIDENKFENKKEFEKEIIKILIENDIELIVMAGWMKIASEDFVNNFENKIINIHPSLLPSFKGKNPISDALKNKSLITGCSVHFVDKEIDNGQLIMQAALCIDSKDNIDSLTKKIHDIEHKILPFAVSEAGLKVRNQLWIKRSNI